MTAATDYRDTDEQESEPVSVQLRRRREAALRCPRLECGRRDPFSRSRW